MTSLLFCSDPQNKKQPHSMWKEEYETASNLGPTYLFSFEDFAQGKIQKSLKSLPQGDNSTLIYHGWMILPEMYEKLYQGLFDKGYNLINGTQKYLSCHHFANWYPIIKDYTPRSAIVKSNNPRDILDVARTEFKDSSLIIKDFVSSQKHNWETACFIPNTRDIINTVRVISTFLALQNEVDGVQGGVVLREFVPLKSIGLHPKSKMPLSMEFRSFVLDGEIISTDPYWETMTTVTINPPKKFIRNIANLIFQNTGNRLFTIDVAQKENDDWICIEIGEGQVSSFPDLGDKNSFYKSLFGAK